MYLKKDFLVLYCLAQTNLLTIKNIPNKILENVYEHTIAKERMLVSSIFYIMRLNSIAESVRSFTHLVRLRKTKLQNIENEAATNRERLSRVAAIYLSSADGSWKRMDI